jgi:hypothetical protein
MSNNNPTSQDDVFGNKERLLKIWSEERKSRDFNATLMWENLKLFSVLIPAIITVDTFFLKMTLDNSLAEYTAILSLFSLVFPIMIISLTLCGNSDLRRRWERTLEAIAHLHKIEDLLGLNEPVTGRINVLKDDSHLFQRYYDNTKHTIKKKDNTGKTIEKEEDIKSEQDFIDKKLYEHNMYTAMRNVYWVFGIIGAALLLVPLTLLFYQRYLYFLTLNQ